LEELRGIDRADGDVDAELGERLLVGDGDLLVLACLSA
jgi:hypothetical protein